MNLSETQTMHQIISNQDMNLGKICSTLEDLENIDSSVSNPDTTHLVKNLKTNSRMKGPDRCRDSVCPVIWKPERPAA